MVYCPLLSFLISKLMPVRKRNMINLKNKYYKVRIIVTFALISILLLLGMSRASYYFVKDLYLQQLSDQLTLVSNFLTEDIDEEMIELLDLGEPTSTVRKYFSSHLQKPSVEKLESEIFIFNNDMEIVFSSETEITNSEQYPELFLYQSDIISLTNKSIFVTTPFKGIDQYWYLYSFQKIGSNLFLAIKAPAVKFSKIEEFDFLFWMLGFAGVIIIVIISWFLANSIIRPIYKLVNFSEDIGNNNLDSPAPGNMKGELSILSRTMDTMRKNILRHQKERENMLAQIAHEIRNPLGGIELLAGLTREDLEKNNLSGEYPKKILDEVCGLKKLITSYLNYSKPTPATPEDVSIEYLVDDVQRIFENKLKEKNIDLRKEITVPKIKFDKEQLKHIIMNLVANSIDAIKSNGLINILTFSINGNVIISVTDDGTGIADDNSKNIFEPFFTTKKEGIGLGLAISKKYCDENNAEIKLTNNSPQGVTFSIIKEV